MIYKINKDFNIDLGFKVDYNKILNAVLETNKLLADLPTSLFNVIDYKTTSTMIGRFFCDTLVAYIEGAVVNPIEKGHPDIIPAKGKNASEIQLRNYPTGLEVKCTVGNIQLGANLRAGSKRIDYLNGITWQAHHQEVKKLMGLVWDFSNVSAPNSYLYPAITGVFYTDTLENGDWGVISGTTGRNTKVCGMMVSGRKKMGKGWVLIDENYFYKYLRLLGIPVVNDNC